MVKFTLKAEGTVGGKVGDDKIDGSGLSIIKLSPSWILSSSYSLVVQKKQWSGQHVKC